MQPTPSAVFHLDPRWRRSMVRKIVPLALLLGILVTVLGSVSATWFGDVGGSVVGVVLGVGVVAGILVAFVRRGRALAAVCALRLSPWGIELWGVAGVQQQMAWPDVERLSTVDVTSPRSAGLVHVTPQAFRTSMVADGLRPTEHVSGVAGWSRMLVGPARGPRVVLPLFTPDPRTGKVNVTIPFSEYDVEWEQGPIGAWVSAYRPDVLPPHGSVHVAVTRA